MSVSLIALGVSAAVSGYQMYKAGKDEKKAKADQAEAERTRATLTKSQAQIDEETTAANLAGSATAPGQAQTEAMLDRQQANAQNQINQMGGSAAARMQAISQQATNRSNQQLELGIRGQQFQQQNIQNQQQVRQRGAEFAGDQFEYNVNAPWQRKSMQADMDRSMAIQNKREGLNQLMNAGTSAALNWDVVGPQGGGQNQNKNPMAGFGSQNPAGSDKYYGAGVRLGTNQRAQGAKIPGRTNYFNR